MTDAQKSLSMANFNNLTADNLDSVEIRPLNVKYPGDVFGQGLLPKSEHLLERTPNLRVVSQELNQDVVGRVRIAQPKKVLKEIPSITVYDKAVIEQPEFYSKDIKLEMPSMKFPEFIQDESMKIGLPEVEAIALPALTMPGNITAALPQVQLADLNTKLPDVEFQNQQIDFPSVDVQKIDTELPEVSVGQVEHSQFPDVFVPGVEADLPDIDLPSDQNVDMPQIEVPSMDHSMPSINVPAQVNMNMPDVDLPSLDTNLPSFDMEFAAQPDLPEFQVPVAETSLPSFNTASTINVDMPKISMPELNIQQAPQMAQIDINAYMPNVKTQAFAARPSDIATRKIKGVIVPTKIGMLGKGPVIPNMNMSAMTAVVPKVSIPKINVSLPKASKGQAVEIRKKLIPIPKVTFPLPSMQTYQVVLPSIPQIEIHPAQKFELFAANPEAQNTLVQEHDGVIMTQPKVYVEEETVGGDDEDLTDAQLGLHYKTKFVLVTREVAERMNLQIKTKEEVEAELKRRNEERKRREEERRRREEERRRRQEEEAKRLAELGQDKYVLKKYWENRELPNEVARAYGVMRKDVVPQTDLSEINFVGSSSK
jgi:hypothetical protein